ncbi:MAG TPA: UDP-N-acetylglucosamine 1-carboxyvinyltransferase, partial [Crocinitomicaceae bacterium]|nr:UDP-N-acetylglucosamine 1-carboxyvinyltransferase [Crocinitomicaceae bacterium]
MASFEIHGGKPLKGDLIPQGAKNEALQVLCAPLLTGEKVTISNLPDIVDVNKLIGLLQAMGVKIEKVEKGTYIFQAKDVDLDYLQTEDFKTRASSLRGSVMIVGPLLARFGVGYLPKPGGDKIGRRRLDTHFTGMMMLGAKFNYDAGEHFYAIEGKKLKGAYIHLDEASVTGTANIVMAAVMAEGETTI